MYLIRAKCLFILSSIFFIAGCGKKQTAVKPFRKNITQAVYASGKLYPLNDYRVFTKIPGYVEKILVKVNDTVKVGTPLLLIRSDISEINVNTARNAMALAEENASAGSAMIAALNADISAARSKYQLDSINYLKYQNLLKENAASRIAVDQARTSFEVSKGNYLRSLSSLESTRARLHSELRNARLQYEAQIANRSDFILASAVNGRVYDIVPKEGELVNPQMSLLEIGDASLFEVELNVDETDVGLLKKGQKVLYEIDAYKDRFFEGAIKEVYPRISQQNKTSKVLASVMLGKDVQVYSGMSVEGNIVIGEHRNTLVIPREYIFESNKVKVKGRDEPIIIKTGAADLEYIQVLSGLTEDDELVLP